MQTQQAIVVEGLTKIYGTGESRVAALAGASLAIDAGE